MRERDTTMYSILSVFYILLLLHTSLFFGNALKDLGIHTVEILQDKNYTSLFIL